MKKKNLFIELLLISIIVLLANLVLSKLMFRADLTASKKYTLSRSTRSIIKDTPDQILIEFYVSKNIPSYILNLKKDIWDTLLEYKINSKGKIDIREVDPSDNPEMERKLYMYGIQPVNVNVYEKDRVEVVKTYMGLAVFYKDKVESIPFVQSIEDLEFNLSSMLLKLASDKIPVIGYPEVGAEFNFAVLSSILYDDLSKQYKVIPVNLDNFETIRGLDLLLLPNFVENLSERALYNIDQYIVRGGTSAFFLNGVDIHFDKETRSNRSNIFDLLSSKNVSVTKDLINDHTNDLLAYSYGNRQLVSPYPQFVKIMPQNMNPKFQFLKNIPHLTFGWTSSVNFSLDADVGHDIMFKSSEKAWAISGNFLDIDPTTIRSPQDPSLYRQFILAGIQYGKFQSSFKDRELPEGVVKEDFIEKGELETRLLLVGTAHILKDNFVRMYPNNRVFVLNVIDYLILGDKLSEIRNKIISDPFIGEISDKNKELVKYLNILLMPLIVIVYGIFRYMKRKRGTKIKEVKNETV